MKKLLEKYPELEAVFSEEFFRFAGEIFKRNGKPDDLQIEWFLVYMTISHTLMIESIGKELTRLSEDVDTIKDLLQKIATVAGVGDGATKQ